MDTRPLLNHQKEMLAAHTRGDQEGCAKAMVGLLNELENQPFGVTLPDRQLMGRAILNFANTFSHPDFQMPEPYGFPVLQHNCLIGNLFAGCLKSTTDPYLDLVKGDRQELYKTMVLFSARNETAVDIGKAFQGNPTLVSQWLYQTWKLGLSGMCNREVVERLTRILDEIHPKIVPAADLHQLYFACTYLGNERERRIKEILNQSIQRNMRKPIQNTPNPKRIAVFSDHFWKGHSVYRTLVHFLRGLKTGTPYHLTLLHAAPLPPGLADTELFDEVKALAWNGSSLDISAVEKNNYGALIFPDVGMSLPSIFLANQRIAPVQIVMTGHPSSTFGACADYFISGREVDLPSHAHLNYSERLVLLPGYGAVHEKPTYKRRNPERKTKDLIVNGSWAGQKIHWTFLSALGQIVEQARRPIHFKIFSSVAPLRHKGGAAFIHEISRQLPNSNNEVFGHLNYEEYMARMEEADFALDCFLFGGSNTVSDLLYLGVPVLCREGTRWFGRIGPAMLRSIGLDELVATSDAQYIKKAVRLANEPEYREGLRKQIQEADLDKGVYTPQGASEFRQFMDEVLTNPNPYPGYEPIEF